MRRSAPNRRRCRLSFCARSSECRSERIAYPRVLDIGSLALVTRSTRLRAPGQHLRPHGRAQSNRARSSRHSRCIWSPRKSSAPADPGVPVDELTRPVAVNVIPAIAAHTSRNAGHDDRIVGSLVRPDTLWDLP
jgi:hypothetical protein